jgi:hypothetical protein
MEHKDLGNCKTLQQELMTKQISSLLARLNRQDSLGQLTKLRITQGCQRAGLTEDIWKIEEMPENIEGWKSNLACLTLLKARKLNINVRTEGNLWTMFRYGIKIRELINIQLQKRSGTRISEAGIIYLNQLIDTKGERLITWQQLKSYQGLSSKGKKAEWFKAIELEVLIRPENREIKRQYRTIGQNTQAMQMRWECISEDKRKKEWITHGAQNDRQLGKIVKKKEKKILVEHWQMQSKESELAIEINRCKGCIRVEEHQEDSCQQWIRVNNRINVVPDALIKKGSNKIKIPIDQITETIKTSRLVIEEQKLEGLRIVEEPEVEIVR